MHHPAQPSEIEPGALFVVPRAENGSRRTDATTDIRKLLTDATNRSRCIGRAGKEYVEAGERRDHAGGVELRFGMIVFTTAPSGLRWHLTNPQTYVRMTTPFAKL